MSKIKNCNKALLLSVALACAPFIPVQAAKKVMTVPVEEGAIIPEEYNNPKLLDSAARVIRAYGYRCDSIKTFLPFMMSRGYKVRCSGGIYTYELEDRGGTWVARFVGSR